MKSEFLEYLVIIIYFQAVCSVLGVGGELSLGVNTDLNFSVRSLAFFFLLLSDTVTVT